MGVSQLSERGGRTWMRPQIQHHKRDKDRIRAATHRLRDLAGHSEGEVHLEDFIGAAGLTLDFRTGQDLDPSAGRHLFAALYPAAKLVWIRPDLSPDQKKLHGMHEVMHWWLDHPEILQHPRLLTPYYRDQMEWEANFGAVETCCPSNELHRELAASHGPLVTLRDLRRAAVWFGLTTYVVARHYVWELATSPVLLLTIGRQRRRATSGGGPLDLRWFSSSHWTHGSFYDHSGRRRLDGVTRLDGAARSALEDPASTLDGVEQAVAGIVGGKVECHRAALSNVIYVLIHHS